MPKRWGWNQVDRTKYEEVMVDFVQRCIQKLKKLLPLLYSFCKAGFFRRLVDPHHSSGNFQRIKWQYVEHCTPNSTRDMGVCLEAYGTGLWEYKTVYFSENCFVCEALIFT